jgi:hypothetical protein
MFRPADAAGGGLVYRRESTTHPASGYANRRGSTPEGPLKTNPVSEGLWKTKRRQIGLSASLTVSLNY